METRGFLRGEAARHSGSGGACGLVVPVPALQKGLALCALAMTVAHFLLAIRIGVVTRRGRTPHRAELVISRLFEVFYYKLFG